MREGLIDGMVHCLVDHAAMPKGLNAKEFIELGGGPAVLFARPAAYTDLAGGIKRCVHTRGRAVSIHTFRRPFRS
jgi:hypothetical protein